MSYDTTTARLLPDQSLGQILSPSSLPPTDDISKRIESSTDNLGAPSCAATHAQLLPHRATAQALSQSFLHPTTHANVSNCTKSTLGKGDAPEQAPTPTETPRQQAASIYRALLKREAQCRSIVEELKARDGICLSKEGWTKLLNVHRTLLYEHFDLLALSYRPSSPSEIRSAYERHGLLRRMVVFGIHGPLHIMDTLKPYSEVYIDEFSLSAYQLIATLLEAVPQLPSHTDYFEETLADLAIFRVSTSSSLEELEMWASVAAQWYEGLARRKPGLGQLHLALATAERPCLRKLAMFWKSRQSREPILEDRWLEAFDPTMSASVDTVELCAIELFQLLHSTPIPWTQSTEMTACVADTLHLLTATDLAGYGAPLAALCVASMLGFGSYEGYRKDFSMTVDSKRLEDMHHLVVAPAHAGAELCFGLFNHIVNLSCDTVSTDMLVFVHVVMEYLSSYFRVYEPVKAPYSSRIRWTDLRNFVNCIITLHGIRLSLDPEHETPSIAERRHRLPEDYWIAGTFWSPPFPGETLDAADEASRRASRIVAVGLEIASLTGAMT